MTLRARRSFGSIFEKPRRNGGTYPGFYIRYTDAWGRRREEYGGLTKTAADALLSLRHTARDRALASGERPIEKVTFHEIVPQLTQHWEATLQPSTVSGRKSILRDTAEHFGKKPLVEIRKGDVQQWLDQMRREHDHAPATMRHAAAVLSSAFQYAIDINAAETNPVKGVKLPKVQKKERPFFTDDQRRHIYSHMPEEIRACVMLMGDAGLRRTEAVELTWDAVTEGFTHVSVLQAKNHKTRLVPLTARAAETLRAWWQKRGSTPMSGPVRVFDFTTDKLNALFRKGADAAGYPQLTPHVLRHAFASGLVRAGVDLPTVAKLLGHADIQMAAHYGQWAPQNATDLAIRAFEDAAQPKTSPAQSAGSN